EGRHHPPPAGPLPGPPDRLPVVTTPRPNGIHGHHRRGRDGPPRKGPRAVPRRSGDPDRDVGVWPADRRRPPAGPRPRRRRAAGYHPGPEAPVAGRIGGRGQGALREGTAEAGTHGQGRRRLPATLREGLVLLVHPDRALALGPAAGGARVGGADAVHEGVHVTL